MERTATSVEQRLLQALRSGGLTFAAAESCTGGLIAKRITDLPGASAVFCGGVVSYTNEVKHRVLGVPQQLLNDFGAVSAPVAQAMAEGARQITGADLAASVTGVAGPDRDDRGNDVGTVYIGIATAQQSRVLKMHFQGDRHAIRQQAADCVFTELLNETEI